MFVFCSYSCVLSLQNFFKRFISQYISEAYQLTRVCKHIITLGASHPTSLHSLTLWDTYHLAHVLKPGKSSSVIKYHSSTL